MHNRGKMDLIPLFPAHAVLHARGSCIWLFRFECQAHVPEDFFSDAGRTYSIQQRRGVVGTSRWTYVATHGLRAPDNAQFTD
jgi:hypothetical protein